MIADGKIKNDKYTLDDILFPKGREKLTDNDYKILFGSYNFRQAMRECFAELKFYPRSEAECLHCLPVLLAVA
jgi:hypothetical protein